MSVTFFPEPAPTVGWRLADFFGGADPRLFATYEAAGAALMAAREQGTILPGCDDPEAAALGDGYRIDAVTAAGDDAPEVNISNLNARHILGLLGFADGDGDVADLFGSSDAGAFLGRVLTARALAPADEGVPVTTSGGSGMATLVECGRAPGYSERVLGQLERVAAWSRDHGRTVCWS